MSKRSGTKIRTTIYDKFKGVDFTTDPSLVEESRSPWATNMVADEGGMPEKRAGYRMIHALPDHVVEGQHIYSREVLGMTYAEFRRDLISNITSTEGITVTVTSHTALYDKTHEVGNMTARVISITGVIYSLIEKGGFTIASESHSMSTDWNASVISWFNEYGLQTSGWNTLLPTSSASIQFTYEHDDSYRHYIAVVVGKAMYRWHEGTDPVVIYHDTSMLEPTPSFSCATFAYLNKKLLIFTGNEAFIYDGNNIRDISYNAYVPTTIIGRSPSGGGTTYEAVNYLTGKQTIKVMGNGTSTQYVLPYDSVSSIDKVVVNGTQMTTGWTYTPGTNYITFSTAPSAPSVSGQDNVFITFTHYTEGYAEKITHSKIATVWGISGASDRVVLSGNDMYPNQDYICAYNDPTYWPDTNYSVIGTDATAIMGYRRLGEQLAIIKEDNGQDSTVFLRTGVLDTSGNATFTAFPCLSGIGGVSTRGVGNILDDQLVLTGNGVYAITTNSLTAEKVAENRSIRIDAKLTREDLTDAIVTNFKNMLLIFVNGKVYGLDGKRQKNYLSRNDIAYTYEAFYWENIPANCVMRTVSEGKEELYFGDTTGHVYKFNTDMDSMNKYSDEFPISFTDPTTLTANSYKFVYDGTNWKLDGTTVTLSTYGITAPTNPKETAEIEIVKVSNTYYAHYYTPIEAVWATKADDDGDPMVYKFLLKKGNGVTIKPYTRSSGKIYLRTDKDSVGWYANSSTMDIFDWGDIDFERFAFNSNEAPSEIPINRKVKNYKRLQIIVKNDALNEGFGVYAVTKHYVTGNFAKR